MSPKTKAVLRHCSICGGSTGEVLHTQRFVLPDGHPLSAGYDVVSCIRCGFCYADISVEQKEYDRYYAELSKYSDDKTSTGGGESPWDAERLRQTATDIAHLVPNRKARVIDIGCANGGLLRALSELGYTSLSGIDPSPGCVAQASRVAHVEAFVGSLSHFPDGIGKFDCLLLCHVLEHVKDLRSVLVSVRRILNPGAIVYVETPDATRYSDFVFAPFQEFNTEHINHFSLASLANLLRRNGFLLVSSNAKTFLTAPEMPYPAVFVSATLASGEPDSPPDLVADPGPKARLLDYIDISSRMLSHIDSKLQSALAGSPEVLVWGTGELAWKLLAETRLRHSRIVAFVDGNPVNHGRRLLGIPIIAPDEVEASERPIVVASTLHHAEIAGRILELRLTNPVVDLRTS